MKPKALAPPYSDTLFFSPLAWLKLAWFCHAGPTEVGGFGISSEHNPLYVEDFVTVKQYATSVTIRFDDESVAELFDRLVDQGLQPHRFARLWVHTHPGDSAQPSATDEETFSRTFGNCDWALMFIVSRSGQTYARLSFSAGPGGQLLLPVAVHWPDWPAALHRGTTLDGLVEQWRGDYTAHVNKLPEMFLPPPPPQPEWWDSEPWSPELDGAFFEPTHQGAVDDFPF